MWFKILYVLFLVCQLLYGSYYIGGLVTPRQLMTVVMFIVCYKMNMIKFDKYIKLYIVFLVFYGMSSALTGYLGMFFRQFVGYYIVAYVAYQSTKILINKYRAENLIFYTFCGIGLFDAVITIGQYWFLPWVDRIVDFFSFVGSRGLEELQEDNDSLEGVAVPGIVGDVMNGYFLPVVCIFLWYNRFVIFKLRIFVLWFIAALGLSYVQQRTGFATGIMASLYILYKILSYRMGIASKCIFFVFAVVIITIGLSYGFDYIAESESRYALGTDMSTRSRLYSKCFNYMLANPLGGIFECAEKIGMPHNLFLNAFIYGGYIGGLFVLYIIFDQLKICVRTLVRINVKEQFALLLMVLAWFSFLICSFAHNLSVVTGDVHVWIFWAAIMCLIDRGNKVVNNSLVKTKYR